MSYKGFVLFSMFMMPLMALAQKQYFLPTGDATADEKDRPMIEVYLPQEEVANGCAVVLCPGGAMRWLSWESDVVKMASFLNERGIAATMSADGMERPDFLCTNFGPSLMPVAVTQNAPPLLIMTRADHPNVAAGLVALFMEWKKVGANAELHIYGDGKGPYELMPQTGESTTETWSGQMIQWLKAKGFINKK